MLMCQLKNSRFVFFLQKMGEVILGMPGPWAEDNCEAADHYTTKIGGLPDWPFPFPDSIIKPHLTCDSCGQKLCLVAQIYAPISTKTEERVIYIFTCISTACEITRWRALRVQKSNNDNQSLDDPCASPSTTKLQDDDPWAFDDDDDGLDLDDLCRALTQATTLASASKTKKDPIHKDKPSPISITRPIDDNTPVLPCFYIYTQEEKYLKDKNTPVVNIKEKVINGDDEVWEGETYEYDRAVNADRIYLKFKKRLDMYPDHCFRYSYGGGALLASSEVRDPGRCLVCGEIRQYEMQLMPPLIYFLQEAVKNQLLENWNWLSVIVYTCSKGCVASMKQECDGWIVAEEAVVIQME
ncbi:hypothetical protein LXL04_014145 [Taraxacum kok-saghyz]